MADFHSSYQLGKYIKSRASPSNLDEQSTNNKKIASVDYAVRIQPISPDESHPIPKKRKFD